MPRHIVSPTINYPKFMPLETSAESDMETERSYSSAQLTNITPRQQNTPVRLHKPVEPTILTCPYRFLPCVDAGSAQK
jgi:hypothetical protein